MHMIGENLNYHKRITAKRRKRDGSACICSGLRELKPFLNEIGQLTAFPAKHKKQLMALWYLAEKIEPCKEYTKPEINGIINSWHTFGDQATLRRELINKQLLFRNRECSRYWAEKDKGSLEDFINDHI